MFDQIFLSRKAWSPGFSVFPGERRPLSLNSMLLSQVVGASCYLALLATNSDGGRSMPSTVRVNLISSPLTLPL